MAYLGEFGREVAELDTSTPPEDDTFTFHGVQFTIRRSIGAMPLLRYSWRAIQAQDVAEQVDAARAAARTDDERAAADAMLRGLIVQQRASVYEYLHSVIGDEQWPEFERVADAVAATEDELLGVSRAVIAAVAARPTRRPSGSAGGPSPSGGGSGDGSSSTATGGPAPGPAAEGGSRLPGPGSAADAGEDPAEDVAHLTDRERAIAAMGMVPLDQAAAAARAARSGT